VIGVPRRLLPSWRFCVERWRPLGGAAAGWGANSGSLSKLNSALSLLLLLHVEQTIKAGSFRVRIIRTIRVVSFSDSLRTIRTIRGMFLQIWGTNRVIRVSTRDNLSKL
jgi:hypothetical protein